MILFSFVVVGKKIKLVLICVDWWVGWFVWLLIFVRFSRLGLEYDEVVSFISQMNGLAGSWSPWIGSLRRIVDDDTANS